MQKAGGRTGSEERKEWVPSWMQDNNKHVTLRPSMPSESNSNHILQGEVEVPQAKPHGATEPMAQSLLLLLWLLFGY